MTRIPALYPIVSRVAAVVLLAAGGLKTQELLTAIDFMPPSWVIISRIALELLFGAWLLIGLYPRVSRIVALLCFLTFLNVALAQALQGHASCGCFGKFPVRPWSVAALDGLMIVGFLLAPACEAGQVSRIKWVLFGVLSLLLLLLPGLSILGKLELSSKHIPSTLDAADMPMGVDAAAVERVIDGVSRNHAALHTIMYTSEKTVIEHPTKAKRMYLIPDESGQKKKVIREDVYPPVEKTFRGSYKNWVRGEEVRTDCLTNDENGDSRSILLGSKEKRIQYSSRVRQAWLGGLAADRPDTGFTESIDLRCAGFWPPLKSIGEWLKTCEVLQAGLAKDREGREVIRVHVLAPVLKKDYKNDVTVNFVPAMNYLPSRVVYRYNPSGGVAEVADIEYQQVKSTDAWFLQTIKRRCFLRDTTADPDATTGHNISSHIKVQVVKFGGGVGDDDFDPIIPANTRLMGVWAAQSNSGDAPIRASKLMRPIPITVTPKTQAQSSPSRRALPPWRIALGMDAALLGICFAFRRRLTF